jgi:hypothetical protein
MYSTSQSNHFLHIKDAGARGVYNSSVVKAAIETLLDTIKSKEANNNEI